MNLAAVNPLDPGDLLQAFGLFGVFAILFAETGLLFGFFLPGDSLLFVAGVGAAGASAALTGVGLPLPALLVGAPIAAIAGSQVGYLIGRVAGRRLLYSRHHKKVKRAEAFFAHYGYAKAIFLTRFIGVLRTAMNPTAGALGVPPWRFFLLNVASAIVWTDGVLCIGYFVGGRLSGDIDDYLTPIILGIMVVATTPAIVAWVRRPRFPDEIELSGAEEGTAQRLGDRLCTAGSEPLPVLNDAETEAATHALAVLRNHAPDGPTRELARELLQRLSTRSGAVL